MSKNEDEFDLDQLGLGKPTEYQSSYSPRLLQAVPRSINRRELAINNELPFYGADVWHGYELSWLNTKGKPNVALMRATVPCSSPNLIESKSFKLYLNSFNQTHFEHIEQVRQCLIADLSVVAGCEVDVQLFGPEDYSAFDITALSGCCIDDQDIRIDSYTLNSEVLKLGQGSEQGNISNNGHEVVSETLHSHLLKSNCLITNQPDWASVIIQYSGQRLCRESLLKYLVSFRMHNEFHEQCVERIFVDLTGAYQLEQLSVQALYTRRGGLDINPFRTTEKNTVPPLWRSNRQ